MTHITRRPLAISALLSAALHAASIAIATVKVAPPAGDHMMVAVEVAWLESGATSGAAQAPPSSMAVNRSEMGDASNFAAVSTQAPEISGLQFPSQDTRVKVKAEADPKSAPTRTRKTERRAMGQTPRRQQSEAGPESTRLGRSAPPHDYPKDSVECTAMCGNHAGSSAAPTSKLARQSENAAHGASNGSIVSPATSADAAMPGSAGGAPQSASGADVIHRVPPIYPIAARRRGVEGAVLLSVRIDDSGDPQHVAIARSSGSDMLDAAAQAAVTQWRFRAGSVRTLDVPISFRLRETGQLRSSDAASGREQ